MNPRFLVFRVILALLTLFLSACDSILAAPPTSAPPTVTAIPLIPTPTVAASNATPTPAAFPTVSPEPVSAPSWARDSVLYQIFVRAFTPQGTLAAAEPPLPDLKDI